eukprot:3619266-Prymnesium_polylepis.1
MASALTTRFFELFTCFAPNPIEADDAKKPVPLPVGDEPKDSSEPKDASEERGIEPRTTGTGLTLSSLGFGTWQFGSAGADDYWGLEFTDELASAL